MKRKRKPAPQYLDTKFHALGKVKIFEIISDAIKNHAGERDKDKLKEMGFQALILEANRLEKLSTKYYLDGVEAQARADNWERRYKQVVKRLPVRPGKQAPAKK